jgi:hypothetical protein
MTDNDRLAQLRVLLERLEQMPASPDRDWMLAEVRSRAVDVDTGIAPRPMRPLENDLTLEPQQVAPRATPAKPVQRRVEPKPAPRRVEARRPAPAPRVAPTVAPPSWQATVRTPSDRDERIDLLALDGLLHLSDDTPPTEPAEGDARAVRPWAGGLRG